MQCRRATLPIWGFKVLSLRDHALGYEVMVWQIFLIRLQCHLSTPGVAIDVITGHYLGIIWVNEDAAKGALRLKSLGH